jgi:hypothetical protein
MSGAMRRPMVHRKKASRKKSVSGEMRKANGWNEPSEKSKQKKISEWRNEKSQWLDTLTLSRR